MAETDAAVEGGKGLGKTLGQKVGPLPLGVWLVIAVGIWYYMQRKQAASTGTGANQQTDPAGNVGSIDPSTGYVYGTPEDQAALASQNSTSSGSSGAAPTGPTGGYADNNAWGSAAINYLVGIGIDPTTANQAVQQYLSSQNLTPSQQGDVNLAIQALGPPPSLPGPTSTNPPPVTTPGGGSGGSTPPPAKNYAPTGGHVVRATNNGAVVAWNGNGATSWRVQLTGPGSENGRVSTVSIPQATYSGLESGHNYSVSVQPLVNGKVAGSSGRVDFQTTKGKR